ncbi:MAG: hypothetical protein MUF23_06265 [Pirellula sp.]|jgi:TRAP-type uncharacterized transport system substrate-binding protein|nr:hypothetical protein [Pirellula sp.]
MKSHPITDENVRVRHGRLRELLLLLIALALLALSVWIWQPWDTKPTIRLRISAGDPASARHRLASSLANHLGADGFELEVVPSQGSEESLEWLNKGEIDLALVQGGLNLLDRTDVRQLCALELEPLHVLVKPEHEPILAEQGLMGLRGKRVFLSSKSAGTYVLSVNLLDFIGLSTQVSPGDTLQGDTLHGDTVGEDSVVVDDRWAGIEELWNAPEDMLPDAIFHVSLVPSPVAHALVARKGYRLVPVPYARAFAQSDIIELGENLISEASEGEVRELNRSLIDECTIPAFSYDVSPDVPHSDLKTLGARMLLVTNRHQSNETIERFLTVLFESDLARHSIPGLDPQALERPSEYAVHPGVDGYRNRNKVLIASDVVNYLENVLAIAATVTGALFFLYQWYAEHRRSQRESRFAEFMTRVIAIEQSALNTEVASKLDLANLIRLQRELADLKADAVQGFAAGEWQGTNMLNGLLALINDTREQITRLILHERENIEQSAASRQMDPDVLWRAEAMGEEDE